MPEVTPIVFIVDEDASTRDSIEALVLRAGMRPVVFGTAREFLAHSRVASPCCLVLDVRLPDANGLDLQQQVAERIEMPVIFMTGCADVATSVRAMKAGALEFLCKPTDEGELLVAVLDAIERSRSVLAHEAELQALSERHASLTRRERQVMALVVAGHLNKQVGGRLGISEITVKAHRGKVMRKMQAASFAHLVSMAARLDLTRRSSISSEGVVAPIGRVYYPPWNPSPLY